MDFKHEYDGTAQGLKRNKLTYALILLVILIIIIGTIFAVRGFTSPKESDINSDSQISQDYIENTTSITQAISEDVTQDKTDEITSTTVQESTDYSAETTITTLTENNATAITFTSTNYADSATNTVKTTTTTRQTSTQATSTKKQATTTTPKQTTKVTTTTTKPVIQAPTEPDYNYKLEDIATNPNAFISYVHKLNADILRHNGYYLDYGLTYGAFESYVTLALLNDGQISDEVIKEVFKGFTMEDIKKGIEFTFAIGTIQKTYNTTFDFSKYTINKEIGEYINKICEANTNGTIDQFVYESIKKISSPENIVNSAGVMAMLATYPNKYINQATACQFEVNDFRERLCETVFGKMLF